MTTEPDKNPYSQAIVEAMIAHLDLEDRCDPLALSALLALAAHDYLINRARPSPAAWRKWAAKVTHAVDALKELTAYADEAGVDRLTQLLLVDAVESAHPGTIGGAALGMKTGGSVGDFVEPVAEQLSALVESLEALRVAAIRGSLDGGMLGLLQEAYPGHDPAFARWLFQLVEIYRGITGNKAARSTSAGAMDGPMVRFIRAAVRVILPREKLTDSTLHSRIDALVREHRRVDKAAARKHLN